MARQRRSNNHGSRHPRHVASSDSSDPSCTVAIGSLSTDRRRSTETANTTQPHLRPRSRRPCSTPVLIAANHQDGQSTRRRRDTSQTRPPLTVTQSASSPSSPSPALAHHQRSWAQDEPRTTTARPVFSLCSCLPQIFFYGLYTCRHRTSPSAPKTFGAIPTYWSPIAQPSIPILSCSYSSSSSAFWGPQPQPIHTVASWTNAFKTLVSPGSSTFGVIIAGRPCSAPYA